LVFLGGGCCVGLLKGGGLPGNTKSGTSDRHAPFFERHDPRASREEDASTINEKERRKFSRLAKEIGQKITTISPNGGERKKHGVLKSERGGKKHILLD